MQVSQALEQYRDAILDLSPRTQEWYGQKLAVFADWCEQEEVALDGIKPALVGRFLAELRKQINPRKDQYVSSYTLHGYAQVIKGFLNWCSQEDGLEELVSEKTPRRIRMPRVDSLVTERFSSDHIRRLFKATGQECSETLVVRDKAILSVLIDTGIRVGELCGLTLENAHLSPRDAYLKVFGKGRKWREVPLGKDARAILNEYIKRYREAPEEEQHVFLNRYYKPMTPNGVEQMFIRLEEWARIKGVRCSAHTCRHTYAQAFLSAGGDVYILSRLLGHTRVDTTEPYLKSFKDWEARKLGISVLDIYNGQS